MNNPNDYLVGLDIGSHKVLCVVALPSPKGEGLYRICGYSFRDSHGVRNGIVTDLNAAVDDIKAAVREARSAGNLPSFRMPGSPSAAPRSRARTAWARSSCEAMR